MSKPKTTRDDEAEGRRLLEERYARHRKIVDELNTPETRQKVWAAVLEQAEAGHPVAKKVLARYRAGAGAAATTAAAAYRARDTG
jgi:hypothetical protein